LPLIGRYLQLIVKKLVHLYADCSEDTRKGWKNMNVRVALVTI